MKKHPKFRRIEPFLRRLGAGLFGSLLTAVSWTAAAIEAPEGVVYCHKKTVIEFVMVTDDAGNDVLMHINGQSGRYMTAYSWYGKQKPPKGFKFAILGKGQFDPLLVFDTYLLDNRKNKYVQCN